MNHFDFIGTGSLFQVIVVNLLMVGRIALEVELRVFVQSIPFTFNLLIVVNQHFIFQ